MGVGESYSEIRCMLVGCKSKAHALLHTYNASAAALSLANWVARVELIAVPSNHPYRSAAFAVHEMLDAVWCGVIHAAVNNRMGVNDHIQTRRRARQLIKSSWPIFLF